MSALIEETDLCHLIFTFVFNSAMFLVIIVGSPPERQ